MKTAKIKCPSCGQEYTLDVGAAASTYRCALCKAEFTTELIEEEQQEVRQLTLDTPAKWRTMFGTPKQQAVAFWIALAFLVGSLIYTPWYHYDRRSGYGAEHPNGWFFIFDTEQGEERGAPIAMQIDYGRLVFQDVIILAIIGGMSWAAAKLRLRPFFTALFILSPPVLILMFVVGKPLYLEWRQRVKLQRERIEEQERYAAWKKAEAEEKAKEAEEEAVEEARAAERARIQSLLEIKRQEDKEALKLSWRDFFKIAVSDCSYEVGNIVGRITHGLNRPIHNVNLKVSIFASRKSHYDENLEMVYDEDHGKLLDIENIVIPDAVNPGDTKTFSIRCSVKGLDYFHYDAQAEVTAATYTN